MDTQRWRRPDGQSVKTSSMPEKFEKHAEGSRMAVAGRRIGRGGIAFLRERTAQRSYSCDHVPLYRVMPCHHHDCRTQITRIMLAAWWTSRMHDIPHDGKWGLVQARRPVSNEPPRPGCEGKAYEAERSSPCGNGGSSPPFPPI